MLAARSEGVPVRVPHGHMTDPCIEDRSFLQRRMFDVYRFFMTLLLDSCGTALVACGPESGAYLYGKRTFKRRGIILNNGIDLSKYKFDLEMRERKRRELGVENKLVVGHVGRLNYIKNHKFLLDVFAELKKINADAVLLIVGEGEEKEAIEEKARRLGIENSVILTGVRDDVYDLLQAMDVFVFPSLKEGLPVTLIEAQATKLPCLISDTVSRYAKQNESSFTAAATARSIGEVTAVPTIENVCRVFIEIYRRADAQGQDNNERGENYIECVKYVGQYAYSVGKVARGRGYKLP